MSPSRRIRLLAVDLDGTLLDDDSRIPQAHREALAEARAAGVEVALASGRALPSVRPFYDDLGIEGLAISCNGARVTRLPSGVDLYHQPVAEEHAAAVIAHCLREGLHLNVYVGEHMHVRQTTEWGNLYLSRTGTPGEPHPDLLSLAACSPTKLLIVTDPERASRLCAEFSRRFNGEVYVTLTCAEYVEFMHRDVNKANGVARAAEALGVPRECVAAAGDSYNDIEMIQWAGLGIAMGNAVDECKEVADVVAPANTEDGLAWAIRECILPR